MQAEGCGRMEVVQSSARYWSFGAGAKQSENDAECAGLVHPEQPEDQLKNFEFIMFVQGSVDDFEQRNETLSFPKGQFHLREPVA